MTKGVPRIALRFIRATVRLRVVVSWCRGAVGRISAAPSDDQLAASTAASLPRDTVSGTVRFMVETPERTWTYLQRVPDTVSHGKRLPGTNCPPSKKMATKSFATKKNPAVSVCKFFKHVKFHAGKRLIAKQCKKLLTNSVSVVMIPSPRRIALV